MNIIEMYEEGKKLSLKGGDRFPYDNPQRLTMNELKERIDRLPDERDENFRGGACSGD